MSFIAFRSGANVLAYEKNNIKYGMVCAWATMVDYTSVAMLVGSQSVTGNTLKVGDIVGISALSSDQKYISDAIGSSHSNEEDKFKNIKYHCKNQAILIDGAKVNLYCKVTKILHLDEESDDNFIIFKVIENQCDESKDFLSLENALNR